MITPRTKRDSKRVLTAIVRARTSIEEFVDEKGHAIPEYEVNMLTDLIDAMGAVIDVIEDRLHQPTQA